VPADPAVDSARLQRFLDALTLVQAVLVLPLAVVFVVSVGEPWTLLPLTVVALFVVGLAIARGLVRRDRTTTAIAVLIGALVPGMIVASAMGDYSLPVLAVAVVIPPVLVVPHLPSRWTGLVLLASVSAAAVLSLVAVNAHRLRFVDDIPDWFETANVVLGAPTASALVMLLARQNHLVIRERTDQLRRSRRALVAGADEERRRAERDLHDGAQQRLQSALVQLSLTRRLAAADPAAAVDVLAQTATELETARADLRRLARGMLPPVLVAEGLDAALHELAADAPLPVVFRTDGVGRMPDDVERAIWFCCAEALQNVAKHAGPDATAVIELERSTATVRFSVRDDGRGFAEGASDGGNGMANMRRRLGAIGGELTFTSAPGAGTEVRGTLPVAGGREEGWQHP
jgi:signal transduction histidine kinase